MHIESPTSILHNRAAAAVCDYTDGPVVMEVVHFPAHVRATVKRSLEEQGWSVDEIEAEKTTVTSGGGKLREITTVRVTWEIRPSYKPPKA